MKFEVNVTFRSNSVIEIDADNAEDATQFVNQMIIDRDLLAEDLDTTEWIVDDAKPKKSKIEVKQFQVLPKRDTGG